MSDHDHATPPKGRRTKRSPANSAAPGALDMPITEDVAAASGEASAPAKPKRMRKARKHAQAAVAPAPDPLLDAATDVALETPEAHAAHHHARSYHHDEPLGENEIRAAALAVNLQMLKYSTAREAAADTPAATWAEGDAEPPFDAPEWDDEPMSAPPMEALEIEGAAPVEPPAVETPPPAPLRPRTPAPPLPPLKPASLDYLRKARAAAQEEAVAISKLSRSIPRSSMLAIATGVAAPLLALGAFAAFNHARNGQAQDLLSPAAVEAHTPDSRELLASYQVAMQRIEAGRPEEGAAILRQVADAGFPMAQYRLAKLYERGEGVRRNLTIAYEMSVLAARGGNCRAMHDAGVFLARGEGVERNEGAAFAWFLRAAELGVSDSQYNVGLLYQQGRGVDANAQEALYWFMIAARQHDLNAIDRAVLLAAEMSPEDVARVRARAHAFSPRAGDAVANGAFDGAAQTCASL
jgi:TPR repeat protein